MFPAYDEVMEVLEETDGGSATVWFGDTPVFGFAANNGEWIHPPYECGRDYKPAPLTLGLIQQFLLAHSASWYRELAAEKTISS
eukprot:g13597.t1